MTISLKHLFVSEKPDGADTSVVRPSDWNNEHEIQMAGPRILGKTTTGQGAVTEVAAGLGLELTAGELRIIQVVMNALVPVGGIIPFMGVFGAPVGWLECGGQAISRTAYPLLWAACGTKYGAGDGSTTFNLPNLRGRTIVGAGSGGADLSPWMSLSLGAIGGEAGVNLSIANLPPHNHTVTVYGSSDTHGGHQHAASLYGGSGSDQAVFRRGLSDYYGVGYVAVGGAHSHSVSASGTTSSVGSGTDHNNIQPSMALYWIARAG